MAISVANVSKCYQSYLKPIHRLMQALNGSKKKLYTEFWALRDADFRVNKGETFGIVGQNGSGKSTLLQIIAGTLRPTSGTITTHGRIAAILELGAGFNPEFSGIENARLNAAIIGVDDKEFNQSLPEIIEFSGLGDFIHKPVKTYSSGMYVRLAFSVSISLKPDILIIDEALAVGDARFQRKCFRKLESLKAEGVTILFVSHSMESVVSHCDRAMFLDAGKVQMIGDPKDVVNKYLDVLFQTENDETDKQQVESKLKAFSENEIAKNELNFNRDTGVDACKNRHGYNPQEYRWGDGRAQIIDYKLLKDGEEFNHPCEKNEKLALSFVISFSQPFEKLIYGMTIKTTDGKTVYGTNNRLKEQLFSTSKDNEIVEMKFEFVVNLAAGDYFISLGVSTDDTEKDHIPLDRRYDLIHFSVLDDQQSFGIAELNASIEQVNSR